MVRLEEAFYLNSVLDIVPDQNDKNKLWLAANNGLYSFDKTTEKISFHGGPQINELYLNCHKIQYATDGKLWVAVAGAGICLYDPGAKLWKTYPPQIEFWQAGNQYANLIFDFEQKSESEWWIIHRNLGLGVFNTENGRYEFVPYDPAKSFSIISPEGFALYKDPQDRIWYLSFRKGLSFLDPAYQMFNQTVFRGEKCGDEGIFNEATDFAQDPKTGKVYVTAHGCDGLYIYDRNLKLQTWAPCNLHPDDFQAFKDVLVDSRGMVWVLSTNNWGDAALLRYNPQTGFTEPFQHPNLALLPIHKFKLTDIAEDSENNLWLSTNFEGLIKIDFQKDTILQYKSSNTNSKGIDPDLETNEMLIAKNGTIWLASLTYGVIQFNPKDQSTRQFGTETQNWRDIRIKTLAEDNFGRIWVGTNTNGIQIIDPEAIEHVTHLGRPQGLPAEQITKIRIDSKGDIWVATLKGLSKYNWEDQNFISYGKKEGLEDIFLINKGLEIIEDGRLFLGQNLSFYSFDVEGLFMNEVPPPVKLTYFKVFEKDYPTQKNLNYIDQINLGYQENFLNIGFSCLNYSASEKNQYAYKLEGLDENWVYRSEGQNFAAYTDLDPGHYTFKVKAANNDAVWNHDGHEIKHLYPATILADKLVFTYWYLGLRLVVCIYFTAGA